MEEREELKPTQTVKQKARLVCGDVEVIRDGVLERVELISEHLPADWAILQLMK